jgi:hypothetical protein
VRIGVDVLAVMGLAEIRLPADQDVHRSLSVMRSSSSSTIALMIVSANFPNAPSDEPP